MRLRTDADLDQMVGAGLEHRLMTATFSMCFELRDAFPEPKSALILPEGVVEFSEDMFMKLLYTNTAIFVRTVPTCSISQIVAGANALRNLARTCVQAKKQYVHRDKTTQTVRLSRSVCLAKIITTAGLLPALATAAAHMATMLQQVALQNADQQAADSKHKAPRRGRAVQKPQESRLSCEDQAALLQLGADLVNLFSDTATWWPGGKLFHAKQFDTCWKSVVRLLLSVLQVIKALTASGVRSRSSELSEAAKQSVPFMPLCADVFAGAIVEGFGFGDFAGRQRDLLSSTALNPTTQLKPQHSTSAIQHLLTSKDLLQVLELNLAVAACGRFVRLLGYSTVPVPPGVSSVSFVSSSRASSSSNSSGFLSQLLQQHQKLRVPAYHDNVLEGYGIKWDDDMETVLKHWHKDWESDAIKALYIVSTYQQQQQRTETPGSRLPRCSWQWKVDRLGFYGYNENYKLSRPPKWDLKPYLFMQALLELIALDPEGQAQNIWMLLQLTNQQLSKLVVTPGQLSKLSDSYNSSDSDSEDEMCEDPAMELEREWRHQQRRLASLPASYLLLPVLQLLGPVVLHVLRDKAPAEQVESHRGVMFFAAQLLTVLIGQGEPYVLAANFYRSLLASATLTEAALRAMAAGQLDPQQQRQQQVIAAAAADKTRTASMQGQAYRVVMALSMGLNGECEQYYSSKASNNSKTAADVNEPVGRFMGVSAKEAAAALTGSGDKQLQLMIQQHMLSLLTTCTKVGAAAVAAAAAENRVGWAAVQLSQVVNQAAMTVELACQLGDLFQQPQQKQARRRDAGKCSSSTEQQQQESPQPFQAGFGPWVALVCRNLLLLVAALQQVDKSFCEPACAADTDAAANAGGSSEPGSSSASDPRIGDWDDDDSLDELLYGPSRMEYHSTVMSVQQVFKCCATAVAWLGKQLAPVQQHIAAAATDTTHIAGSAGAAAAACYFTQQPYDQVMQLQSAAAAALVSAAAIADCDPDPHMRPAGLANMDYEDLPPGMSKAMWDGVLQHLHQYASTVYGRLPLSICCNNAGCTNVDKLSEQQLVGGKDSTCAGCCLARYCSRECQVQHWKQHKAVCKSLQQHNTT